MEGLVVQVISKEMIKPASSSSSSLHPKKLKLSYMDRFQSGFYIPLIFFFESDESRGLTTSNHLRISQQLKQSLSETLPSFYPLAGHLKHNNLFIDCNDSGVQFVDARVRGPLKDHMYKHDQLQQYLPLECSSFYHGNRSCLMLVVQITFFDCGGIVVGAGFSHASGDLVSAMAFLRAWAAASRGELQTARYSFGTTAYFPTLCLLPFSRTQKLFTHNNKFKTKRYVFDKEKLDVLREAATSPPESGIRNPSRVELISAFIWKNFMATRLKNQKATSKIYAAIHAVNVRPRTTPLGLLENIYGNCAVISMAYAARHRSADELRFHELIDRLRSSIQRVRGSYVTKIMNKKSFFKDLSLLGFLVTIRRLEWCYFTSWRGFPFYELDFGWGMPVWFSTPSLPVRNFVVLVSSKNGDDIEAIVTMKPDDLHILDAQINLISTNS